MTDFSALLPKEDRAAQVTAKITTLTQDAYVTNVNANIAAAGAVLLAAAAAGASGDLAIELTAQSDVLAGEAAGLTAEVDVAEARLAGLVDLLAEIEAE